MATPSSAQDPEEQRSALEALPARAASAERRRRRLGLTQVELAEAADLDRGTLARALKADPKTLGNGALTWMKIERALELYEGDPFSPDQVEPRGRRAKARGKQQAPDELVPVTLDYPSGVKLRLSMKADAIAEIVRQALANPEVSAPEIDEPEPETDQPEIEAREVDESETDEG